MATTVNGYPNDKSNNVSTLSAAEVNTLGDGSELHHVNFAELFGPGVIGATDWNLGIVAGQIALTITAGQGIVGDAGERAVRATTATVTIDSDQGLAASNTYYVFKKRDPTDTADPATGFVANTTGTAPADSILIGTAVFNGTEATSVDNHPAERINLYASMPVPGLAADRPAFGKEGRFYFATDTNGGTLWYDTGAAWQQVGPGTSETHVLATTTAIGPRHTVSGLTIGQFLTAISATDVAFRSYITGDVGINTGGANHASAGLQLDSTTKGFLPPRMTTAQGDTLAGIGTAGLMWYDSSIRAFRTFGVRAKWTPGVLYNQYTDKTLASSTAETTLLNTAVGSATLGFSFLQQGKSLRVNARGHISETGTPTLRIKFHLNGGSSVVVMDSGAVTLPASLSNSYFEIDLVIVCQTTGGSGTVKGQGKIFAGSTLIPMVMTATATIDTSSNNKVVDLTAQWGTSDAANTLTITNLTIESLP